jgi:hypothetical protein
LCIPVALLLPTSPLVNTNEDRGGNLLRHRRSCGLRLRCRTGLGSDHAALKANGRCALPPLERKKGHAETLSRLARFPFSLFVGPRRGQVVEHLTVWGSERGDVSSHLPSPHTPGASCRLPSGTLERTNRHPEQLRGGLRCDRCLVARAAPAGRCVGRRTRPCRCRSRFAGPRRRPRRRRARSRCADCVAEAV